MTITGSRRRRAPARPRWRRGAGWALLAAPPPPPEHTPEEVHRTVDEVLSRSEYLAEQPSLLERAISWVEARITEVLTALLNSSAGSWVGVAVFVVIVLAVVALAVWLARGVTPDPGGPDAAGDQPGRVPEAWLADAERLEASGDWLRGLRCRYRALVAALAARGVVEEVPGTTTGAYLRQVRTNAPAAATAFATATELFERAWYGRRPTGERESRQFRALNQQVHAAVTAPVGANR